MVLNQPGCSGCGHCLVDGWVFVRHFDCSSAWLGSLEHDSACVHSGDWWGICRLTHLSRPGFTVVMYILEEKIIFW